MAKKGDCILDRFTVTDTIATTGTTSAYLGRDAEGGMVTILELPIATLDSWEVISKIERRASQYSELSCPSLPRFVGYFSDDAGATPAIYCVYECVEGKSVVEVVEAEGPLQSDQVTVMMKSVLQGLDSLHRLSPPQLHGAIRPDSIVKSDSGVYRFAHLPMPVFSPDLVFRSGRNIEPDSYTPPEQEAGIIEAASDLYSLGMTARFAVTGKGPAPRRSGGGRPAGGSADGSDRRASAPGQPQHPERLGRVIADMTAIDIADRPASAAEVLAELNREENSSGHGRPRQPVQHTDTTVEIVHTPSRDSIKVYNPDASRPENMLISLILDLWASKPWILIIIAAVLSAGPVAIALIIFLFHPKSRIPLNRAFAKTKDVHLTMDRRRMGVSDQLEPVDYSDIRGYDMREIPHPTGLQLETILRLRDGKEARFYINGLNRSEARKIMRLIDSRLHGG